MAILPFVAKLIVSSGLLYGYYHLFLRNKRFHHYNRFYLLAIALLSLVIPFINIPVSLLWGGQQHSTLIQTLKVINANGWEEPVTIYAYRNFWSHWLTIQNGLYFIYAAGAATGFFMLIRSLAWISQLKKQYTYENIEQLKIYNTAEPGTPFSFFRSIFWDENISFNDKRGQQIFRHEMFHVKEKHSADVLFLEILCCACWFNPFFHLIRKEIRAIHEFLADEYAASANNRYDYAELLVAHAITQQKSNLTNPFFHNQIKRRITMITKSNLIRRSGYVSRIMALPLLLLLVSAFAVKITGKQPANAQHYAAKNITVVVDAGHGGTFPGANNIGMQEKDINLDISQKIKQFSGEYNVNIVLTRNDDNLVGNATDLKEDLHNRVKIADEAKPDLFISIHVNQDANNKNTSRTGFEAYISGRQENPKARRFASAVLGEIKTIYPVLETIKQREEGIVVIDRTTYPCILLECGYLNNPKDAAFISNSVNQEKIARKILEGIVKYSNAQTAAIIDKNPLYSDTLSAEALTSVNINDIKSVDTDLHTKLSIVYFKNGAIKYANSTDINHYFAANNIDTLPHGSHAATAHDSGAQAIFTKVEIEPDYPGGPEQWIKYLVKTVRYPQKAIDNEIQGTVVVQFIVDASGKISDVKAISGPKELQKESIRVIKESGNWVSAVQNGKKVNAYKRQPISYKLEPKKSV